MKPSKKKERKKASKLAQSLSNVKDADLTCSHKGCVKKKKAAKGADQTWFDDAIMLLWRDAF